MTYIQAALLAFPVAIFIIAFKLMASSSTEEAPSEAIDAEYRPAEELPYPPCTRQSHGWQDSPSRELFSQLFVESLPPEVLRAMQRHTKELEKVQRWRYYADHAKKGRTRKKYRKKLREDYKTRPVPWWWLPSSMELTSGPGYFSGPGLDSGASEVLWWLRKPGYVSRVGADGRLF